MRLRATFKRAALLMLALPHAAYAANYALLMNISDYPLLGIADQHDLPGTAADLKAFRKYAVSKPRAVPRAS